MGTQEEEKKHLTKFDQKLLIWTKNMTHFFHSIKYHLIFLFYFFFSLVCHFSFL